MVVVKFLVFVSQVVSIFSKILTWIIGGANGYLCPTNSIIGGRVPRLPPKSTPMQVGVSKLGSTEIHLSTRVSKLMGHPIATTSLPRSHWQTYSGDAKEGFCFPTGRRLGALSTRHRRFPEAKGARLHSSNTVATEFTGSEPLRL